MKRPKKLYRINPALTCIEVHSVHLDCAPQLVSNGEHGQLWRCRSGFHDNSGYDNKDSARREGHEQIKREIGRLQRLLDKPTIPYERHS